MLNDFGIKCPTITKEFIYGLINHAVSNNWKNNNNKINNSELCLKVFSNQINLYNIIMGC